MPIGNKWATNDDDEEDFEPFLNEAGKAPAEKPKIVSGFPNRPVAMEGSVSKTITYAGSFPVQSNTQANTQYSQGRGHHLQHQHGPGQITQSSSHHAHNSSNSQFGHGGHPSAYQDRPLQPGSSRQFHDQQQTRSFNQANQQQQQHSYNSQRGQPQLGTAYSSNNNSNNNTSHRGQHNGSPMYQNSGQRGENQQFRSLHQVTAPTSYQGQFPVTNANATNFQNNAPNPPIMRPQARYPQQVNNNAQMAQQAQQQYQNQPPRNSYHSQNPQQHSQRGGHLNSQPSPRIQERTQDRGPMRPRIPSDQYEQRPKYMLSGYDWMPQKGQELAYMMCRWHPMHFYLVCDIQSHEAECEHRPRINQASKANNYRRRP